MIYFIHDQPSRAIKIGYAWNPHRRRSDLQISNSNEYVILGSIPGMKPVERQVHILAHRHDPAKSDPGVRPLWLHGEWFDDRILPFVTELMASPKIFLQPKEKKPPRTRPGGNELRNCSIVLAFDSGEMFRESFTLKTATPELALAALVNIATARLPFLAQAARITRLSVPGLTKEVNFQGAFVTRNCNPREGLSVIFNSDARNGFAMMDGIKQYSHRWFHGASPDLYEQVNRWQSQPTAKCRALLSQFAQVLNQSGCVIIAQNVLPVRGLFPRGIGSLPKGELRSKVNQKAATKRRTQKTSEEARPKLGVVYVLEDTANTDLKIGWCLKKPEKRRADLQVGNPNLLRLVGHIPGLKSHEKRLQRHFSRFHTRGEWFSNSIRTKMDELLKCASLEEWLKNNEGTQPPDPIPPIDQKTLIAAIAPPT